MSKFKRWFCSSVGKKQVVGLTGFGISFFALMHMSGNLLILFSPKAYNLYGHGIVSNPAFPILETLLLAAFLFHIVLASQLWWKNRQARGGGNASSGSGPKRATFASRSMILTGLLLLVFLILHLETFKFGPHYTVIYDGLEVRDLHRLIVERFQDPIYVGWYVLALTILGLHLSHGISSLLQSVGIASARNKVARQVSWAIAIVIAGGFISQPLWIFCGGGH